LNSNEAKLIFNLLKEHKNNALIILIITRHRFKKKYKLKYIKYYNMLFITSNSKKVASERVRESALCRGAIEVCAIWAIALSARQYLERLLEKCYPGWLADPTCALEAAEI
jgi:hypothetical protein